MKHFLIIPIVLLLLTACGFQSPFIDTSPELQELNATASSDPERELGTTYVTTKYLRNGDLAERKKFVNELAGVLEGLTDSTTTGQLLDDGIAQFLDLRATQPEDKALVKYFQAKLQVQLSELSIPLSDEKRRVIGVHVKAMRDTVAAFSG